MIDVAEQFVLLNTQSSSLSGSQLLTREAGLKVSGRATLVALDGSGGRHLLVPTNSTEMPEDVSSQGVALGFRTLRIGDEDVPFIDLACRMPALGFVFERLVDAVLVRLESGQSTPLDTCHRVLDEWRALLRVAGQPVSREVIIGLVGELEVLRRLAASRTADAVEAWAGPSGAVHDFVRGSNALEVKTTTSVDGNFVSISNIDQLDPVLVQRLHLIVVHARETPTAPSLDERIGTLLEAGVPRDLLLTRVANAGYAYESGHQLADRFAVRSLRIWSVGPIFPGLRRADLREERIRGVSRIRYELALDSAPDPLPGQGVDSFFEDWIGSP